MNSLLAKMSAIATVLLLAVALVVLYVTSHPGLQGTAVRAEFENVFPLLEGMNVREYGAVAGSIRHIQLTDRGTAMVTVQLNQGTDPPRRDATAAIRQQDITGDSYLALFPGTDPQPLGDGVIPPGRTLISPRFDDLLNSFNEPVRQGLKLILEELGMAAERRGEDINKATLQLRPALAATDQALAEVDSQNRTLRRLVTDAERVSSQGARRSRELGRLVDALAGTLDRTAEHTAGLDSALAVAPQTTAQARVTLAKLADAATAARPLAETVGRAAPGIALAAVRLGPFLRDTRAALGDAIPTLELTRRLLRAAEPTLAASSKRIFTAPFDLAGGVHDLLQSLLGSRPLLKALFGADSYGTGPSAANDIGLPSIANETGLQQGYGANDPARHFLRAVAIPSCEMFGLKIEPGCLRTALGLPRKGRTPATAVRAPGSIAGGPASQGPASPLGPLLGQLPGALGQALNGLTDQLGVTKGGGKGGKPSQPGQLNGLLDYLLAP